MNNSKAKCSEEVEFVFIFFFSLLDIFFEVLRKVSDFDVMLEGKFEFVHFLLECLSLWGLLECNHSSVNRLSLLVIQSSSNFLLVNLLPLGFLEGFEFRFNIFEFIINVIKLFVVNLKTSFVVVDGFVELLENIFNLFCHLLASFGGQKFLVKSLDVFHLLGVFKSFEG